MKRESSTVPVRPPPLPWVRPPLFGVFGPIGSWQQSSAPLSDSSKVTITRPPSAYAGDLVILGIQVFRKSFALWRPPGLPSTHGSSCPSLHRSGVMKEYDGVFAFVARSPVSALRSSTFELQIGRSMIEWK